MQAGVDSTTVPPRCRPVAAMFVLTEPLQEEAVTALSTLHLSVLSFRYRSAC